MRGIHLLVAGVNFSAAGPSEFGRVPIYPGGRFRPFGYMEILRRSASYAMNHTLGYAGGQNAYKFHSVHNEDTGAGPHQVRTEA
jgi:hypothetical protein